MKILSNKMALGSCQRQQKYARFISSKSSTVSLTVQKHKSPHCYASDNGTLNRYEH